MPRYRISMASFTASPSILCHLGPSLFLSNALRAAKAEMEAGRPFYNRFFAVGLFRVLGLAGSATPQALDELCALCAAPVKRVHADLLSYKMMLSKLHPRSRPATVRLCFRG